MTGSLLRTLTARPDPEAVRPSVAKTISTLAPQVVAPAAADPAVLVDVHSDLRMSLARLASENDVILAERYLVTRLATGCIDLAPELDPEPADEPAGPAHEFGVLSVDRRSRRRLTRALLGRLAVPVGSKVLVTFQPEGQTLRLLNLATLADAVEAQLAAAAASDPAPSVPRPDAHRCSPARRSWATPPSTESRAASSSPGLGVLTLRVQRAATPSRESLSPGLSTQRRRRSPAPGQPPGQPQRSSPALRRDAR